MFCSLFYLAILVINRVGKTISLLIGVGISGIILLVMALFQFVFSDEIVSKAMELTMRAVGFMSDGTINQFFPILSFLIIGALFGIGSYAVIRRTELKENYTQNNTVLPTWVTPYIFSAFIDFYIYPFQLTSYIDVLARIYFLLRPARNIS